MSVLSWGKPLVEWAASTSGAPSGTYTAFSEIKEDTAKLTTTAGTKKEATQEGGGVIDVRYGENKYQFEVDLFVKKGDKKPFVDVNGVVAGNYAVRLTPEDDKCEGFIMENCTVTCQESYASADGMIWKYLFDGLTPASGNICKPYTKASE